MPEALGKYVFIKSYVDANYTGEMANKRSHSVIIIYVNNAPIIWYSKRQNTVEDSSCVSESVALRIDTEMIEDLRYKLRCFVMPVEGPAEVFCVGIYCPLIPDWIELTQAQILFYRQMQDGDTEPNSKYCLEEYFNKA